MKANKRDRIVKVRLTNLESVSYTHLKRTMQIDVIEEVKGSQFMQCKLYRDGNASVILMNKFDYERLLSDSFFISGLFIIELTETLPL